MPSDVCATSYSGKGQTPLSRPVLLLPEKETREGPPLPDGTVYNSKGVLYNYSSKPARVTARYALIPHCTALYVPVQPHAALAGI
jgi:hypothetical protein